MTNRSRHSTWADLDPRSSEEKAREYSRGGVLVRAQRGALAGAEEEEEEQAKEEEAINQNLRRSASSGSLPVMPPVMPQLEVRFGFGGEATAPPFELPLPFFCCLSVTFRCLFHCPFFELSLPFL